MRARTASRILADLSRRGLKASYWELSDAADRLQRLWLPTNPPFRRRTLRELAWYDGRPWRASYPETTGYIITSLLAFADAYGHAEARARTLRMARWEIAVQMERGAVQGGLYCLCAWALYRHGQHRADRRCQEAAVLTVEASIERQLPGGWLRDNCLTRPEAPLSHTIGYALQAILEVGVLAGRRDFVEAAERGIRPLVARISPRGFLLGRFYADWEPACWSSCLTGSAQLAVVCCRLGPAVYHEALLEVTVITSEGTARRLKTKVLEPSAARARDRIWLDLEDGFQRAGAVRAGRVGNTDLLLMDARRLIECAERLVPAVHG